MSKTFPRREFLKSTAAMGAGALAMPAFVSRAWAASDQLNIWAYNGFVTEEFRNRFEKESGIRLNIRLVSDQGEQFNLLAAENGNFSTDIVCCAGHRFYQFVDASFLEPVDTSRLSNWSQIETEYAEADWVSRGGQRWGVPLLIASMGLLYNTETFTDTDSWAPMFAEENKGRIAYQIQDFFPIAMDYLGFDGSAARYRGNTDVAQRAVDATRDFLIGKKPLVRRFYDSGTEVQQMMVNGDIALAQSWSGAASKLILDGFPASYTIPKEGGWAFAYGFNIVRGAKNLDNAYRFLDALLASPENGAAMVRETGYISALKGTEALLSDEERKVLFLSPEHRGRLTWVNVETAPFIFDLIDKAAEEIRAA
ncbi:extracellular solute-binding protein [Aquamicrobium sp. NLF2-7]|uniref:ABC transporter substrate-binding protein n=1 Tax=Aquamicrobium sp. NLF2-7 TaxID=2918753 RepID=UPI001EFA63CB|nr:extracellular solute-binding protein [Aquamicrobium sp. NLF2-7]MCG8272655.1 extracellular solute-binding protein [Aquamicrobium sp. NLF2-7]